MNIIKTLINKIFNKHEYEKFIYIVPLGHNCETAFRFWQNYRFLDSSIFAWTYIKSIKDLVYALSNLDIILSGEVALPNPLYECQNTHIRFHGKENMKKWINCKDYDMTLVNNDLTELKSRTNYLREKFKQMLKSEKSKLFIYKLSLNDIELDDLNNYIEQLYLYFFNNTVNFKLIIVTEDKYKKLISFDRENLKIEAVNQYSPDSDVTNKRKGDKKGWRRIFKKYRPAILFKKKKKFKFEDI